jgi:hypothetical protein
MDVPDKARVLEALIERLSQLAAQATAVAKTTRAAATHAEAKPENDKDTRALEQSYLARGQAMRAEDLHEQIQVLRFMPLRTYGEDAPIGAGALVRLDSDEDGRWIFLAPHGGGIELAVSGVDVMVITPQSSLGALVLGRTLGEEVELRLRNARREYVIAAVR